MVISRSFDLATRARTASGRSVLSRGGMPWYQLIRLSGILMFGPEKPVFFEKTGF